MRSSITVAASLVRAPTRRIEIVDVDAHRLGDFVGALAQPLHQLAAIDLHGAVEFGEMLGDQIAERLRVARNLLGELGAAMGEHLLERLQARAEHFAHASRPWR